MRATLALILILGCGNGTAKISDGAVDVRPVDAALPDALLDAPPPPLGARRYVIDREMVPTTANEARMYGLDLDNDGTVDNQFGMVQASLAGMGTPVQAVVTHVIDTGSVITLVDLEADDLITDATASLTLYTGANAMPTPCNGSSDTTCRHHLAGTATFSVAATSAHDTPLTGAIAANALTSGPGMLHFPVTVFGATVSVQLIGARVKLSGIADSTVMAGIVAGAIPKSEIDTKLIPAIGLALTAQIAVDCHALTSPPACGCTSGSSGATTISLFDANADCAVSNDEISNNSLFQALFAPDVSIDNVSAVSFGVGITAIHASFTP